MSRIYWSDRECSIVAQAYVRLRAERPLENTLPLLLEAQGELDALRQRGSATLTMFKRVTELVPDLWEKRFGRTASDAVAGPPDPPTAPVPSVTPLVERPAAPCPPPEPLLIEIRAEKVDMATALKECPTAFLLGHALERVMSLWPAASAPAPTAPTTVRVETPARLQADRVLEATPAQKRDVVVLGLLNDAITVFQSKLPPLANLNLSFIASGSRTPLPGSTPCDYLYLTTDVVTKFQSEQIRRRLGPAAGHRIITFDGTQGELLASLLDLNDGKIPVSPR